MKTFKAVALLKKQKEDFNEMEENPDVWMATTSGMLEEIFPVSGRMKIAQVKDIKNTPTFLQTLSPLEKGKWRRTRIDSYLNNYIEEIEAFGSEDAGDKISNLIKNTNFWIVLLIVALVSFVAGVTAVNSKLKEKTPVRVDREMEREIILQKREIDSLKIELEMLKTFN